MKRNYSVQIFLIFVTFTGSIGFSQTQRLSQVTRQISEPTEMCTLTSSNETTNARILAPQSVSSRTTSVRTGCSTFIINYDSAFQLNDEARNAFDAAADIWTTLLESSVPITINANLVTIANPNVIGNASNGGFFVVAGQPENTAYHSALAEKLLGTEIINSSGDSVDITINMNQNFNFYFGLDPNGISAQETDFITIVLHEIGHGIGMSGTSRANAVNGFLRFGGGLFTAYDSFLVQDLGFISVPLLQQNSSPGAGDGFDDPSSEMLGAFTSGQIVTTSPRAMAANNGDSPEIFSPNTYSGGSSINHLDENSFNPTPDALMTPFAGRGEVIRNPGEIVLGLFEDMGWSRCVLSTDEFDISSVTISPNPFTNTITLNLPASLSNDTFNVSLIDINGRVILNQTPQNINGELTISDLSNLEASLYFLTIESATSNISITKKIVKN